MAQEIKVPDIGDFDSVEIIEVLVAEGDTVEKEQALITLESDKATLEVPSTAAGKITSLKVSEGDTVSEGDVIATVETDADDSNDDEPAEDSEADTQSDEPRGADASESTSETKSGGGQSSSDQGPKSPAKSGSENQSKSEPRSTTPASEDHNYDCDVLVLGSGPGGYTAAFRAADMGLDVTMVERHSVLGGVCLNVGCIPSKALLHSAKVIEEAANMASHGVTFGKPEIELAKLLEYKQSVIDQLTGGLKSMASKRRVNIVNGTGTFADDHTLAIDGNDDISQITFNKAIIAVGSEPVMLPGLPDDKRIWDSEAALSPDEIPDSMLLIGGGIIGVEIANVYAAHGTTVDIVEMTDGLLPGADRDLVKPLHKRMAKRCDNIWLNAKVTGVEAGDKLTVTFEGGDAPETKEYDRVLVAVGRKPNGKKIGAENANLEVNERGFIPVDKQCRTNVDHIFAIGDVSGEPQLAHRASHQGKVAAECCAGEKSAFDAKCIPSVVYTDPEVAWTGVTETQAKKEGIEYTKGAFPWAANGRAIGLDAIDGNTKLLFDAESGRIIGAGAVGSGAGDLIAETCLAIEMGADAHDIGLTIHPHPTLAETVGMAAEAEAGTLTDLYIPKKKK
ncbi:dihydrolipoyl dehydrogenase [Salinisphaera sp.]|uniref:dihydrolipoyl dehydrogenase n=1 Tax=Salinisphaera sp. TaxID=1914330 RepID=UPI0032C22A28